VSGMADLRSILRSSIAAVLPDEPVDLLFSGGTDSLSVLWTLLDLGASVTCLTFHLSYFESADARASRAACARWSVPLIEVTEDERPVEQQLRDVIAAIGSARKTHVEVAYGYNFLLASCQHRHVFSGIQADTLYGSNKNAAIRQGKASAEEFTAYRRALLESPDQEGLAQMRMLAACHGKVLHAPYADEQIRAFFMRYSWQELNRPRQKMPAVLAFADRFAELAIYRHDDNMQCGSHVREHLAAHVKEYRRILDKVREGA